MTDKKDDLTRLDNIAAFLHEDDAEVDDFFSKMLGKDESKVDAPAGEDLTPPPFEETLEETPKVPSFEESAPDFQTNLEASDDTPPSFDQTGANFGDEAPIDFGDSLSSSSNNNSANENAPDFGGSSELEFNDQAFDRPQLNEEKEQAESKEEGEVFNDFDSPSKGKLPLNNMVDETYQDQVKQNTIELVPHPVNEPVPDYSRNFDETHIAHEEPTAKENFEEIKQFATHLSYGDVTLGGNPPFSIVLKNIQYVEDAEDLLIILKEHGVIKDNNEETFRKSLQRGTLIVSHISEYSAVYLCHKFRRFNLDVLMGLSDEIHPPKTNEETPNRGLINKKGIKQNYQDHFDINHEKIDLKKIIITTTNLIEAHEIKRYIGVASEHFLLGAESFIVDSEKNEREERTLLSSTLQRIRKVKDLTKDMNLEIKEKKPTVKELYDQLGEKIKIQVLKMGGNAMVGVQYQIQSLSGNEYHTELKYKLTCTGTVVWASRI
ncbi:MAG: hypothetical protein ACOYL6_07610 [Bacteriovoracaceae bacterium]